MPSDKPPLYLTAALRIDSAADPTGDKPAKISGVAYGGALLPIGGILYAIDLAGADLPASVPLLAGHSTDQLENIAGQVSPRVSAGKILIEGTVSRASAAGRTAIGLAKDSVLLQCSVGYQPTQTEVLPPGEMLTLNGRTIQAKNQAVYVVRRGTLKEVSLVGVGADSENHVSIAASKAKGKTMSTDSQQNAYSEEHMKLAATAGEGLDLPERLEFVWRQGGAWKCPNEGPHQRAESAKLACACGKIPFADFQVAMLREQLNDRELAMLRAERPKGPGIRSSSRDDDGGRVLECALSRSMGLSGASLEKSYRPEVLEASDRFRSIGIQEVLVQAAAVNGYDGRQRITAGNLAEVLRAAFQPSQTLRASGVSTHSVAGGILSNVANKTILDSYAAIEQSWREIASVRPVADFKTATFYRLTSDAMYEELGPGGEITHGVMAEESYTNQAKTHAKMYGITRTDIINDDLGAFAQVNAKLGRGAALKLNSVFWTKFLDNGAFFTSARENYFDGAETALSETSLGTAVQKFRSISDGDGMPLGIQPAILLVSPDNEALAKRLYVSSELRDTTASTRLPTGNIYERMFRPVVSSYLSNSSFAGYSTTAWFLLADPTNLATAEVVFLNGQESPTVESADFDFNMLGISFRGYHDFGATLSEWRAGVRSKGEA